jgi:glutamyl-tRNA reductase
LVNRSREKIQSYNSFDNVNTEEINQLEKIISKVDAVIVATNAQDYIISEIDEDLTNSNKLFIDLSVPRNINPKLDSRLKNDIVTIDTLETAQKEVIKNRIGSISSVENILSEFIDEYKLWLEYAELSPLINTLKANLKELRHSELQKIKDSQENFTIKDVEIITERMNNKILVQFIQFLKNNSSEKEIQKKLKELIGF